MKTAHALWEVSQSKPWNRLMNHRGKTACTRKGRWTSLALKSPLLCSMAVPCPGLGLPTLAGRRGKRQEGGEKMGLVGDDLYPTCFLYFLGQLCWEGGNFHFILQSKVWPGTIRVFLPTRYLAQSLIFPALITVASSLLHSRLHRALGKGLWAVRAYRLGLLQLPLGYTSDLQTDTVTVGDWTPKHRWLLPIPKFWCPSLSKRHPEQVPREMRVHRSMPSYSDDLYFSLCPT